MLEGEFAPALMLLHHSLETGHAGTVLLFHFLRSLASNIAAGTAQAKCLVFVVTERRPESYQSFLVSKEEQPSWLHFVDCYTDPLGWRKISNEHQILENVEEGLLLHSLCHNLGDLSNLFSIILRSGQVTSGSANKAHFSVVIDSISSFLRHNSVKSMAKFLHSLRSHGEVSSMIWLLHSDLHHTRTVRSLEYISSIVVSIEQLERSVAWKFDESTHDASNTLSNGGVIRLRQKRRNGRVREQVEKFKIEGFELSTYSRTEGVEAGKTNVPQVQFKLQLSEKEQNERAKVVLPFEHQGNGRESYIYNGRPDTRPALFDIAAAAKKDLAELTVENSNATGEVNYLRDSEDERPDSDEDPDDDLDI